MSATFSSFLAGVRAVAVVTVLIAAAGCASAPGRTEPSDPLQTVNRGIYKFNDVLDRNALKPLAKGYQKVTPRWFRAGVGNFFANLSYPTTIVNQFLQGKGTTGFKDTGRFLVNTTVGLGGLLDVATPLGLDANDEDFGQTLAVWGVGSGPFINLPVFGPSSLRDAPSKVVDFFLDPLIYADLDSGTRLGLKGLELVDKRAELLQLDSTLQGTFDPYTFIRDAWARQRQFAIYDGNPPQEEQVYEDLELEEEAPAPAAAEPTP